MNTIQEFKEVIEGDYKITDLHTYGEYKSAVSKRGITKNEVEKLSPDNVNSSSFWEYIEKNPEIAKDAICFGVKKDDAKEEVNKRNFSLACAMNVFCPVLAYKDCTNMPILDIGAGYGMLKEFVEQYTKLRYIGVDVYPKVEGVLYVGTDGSTLPNTVMFLRGQFGLVMSINVFQHLSIKQRRHYYEQISELLHPTCGVFTFSMCCVSSNGTTRGFKCEETGREYMCHYGQYTELQTHQEVMEDINKHFIIQSVTQRGDSYFTYQVSKKPPEVIIANLTKV